MQQDVSFEETPPENGRNEVIQTPTDENGEKDAADGTHWDWTKTVMEGKFNIKNNAPVVVIVCGCDILSPGLLTTILL